MPDDFQMIFNPGRHVNIAPHALYMDAARRLLQAHELTNNCLIENMEAD